MRVVKGVYDDDDQFMMLATLTMDKPEMGMIFYLGVISGLRISDLLALRVRDVGDAFRVVESKTKKIKLVQLPPEGWLFLQAYIDWRCLRPDDLLFPTTRQTVHKYFKKAAEDLGLDGIGPHSMRKIYAWNVFRVSGCLNTTRKALNHKYASTTVLYLIGGFVWALKRAFGGKPINEVVMPCYSAQNTTA